MNLDGFVRFCNGIGITIEPFQKLMLRDYFDGVRELVIIVPKKNGKTTLLAALALYHLVETENADVAVVASTAKQAMKLFDAARELVQAHHELQETLRVLRGYREIRKRDPEQPNNPKVFLGVMTVYAADADTVDGWGGTLALVDELHRQKSGDLYGVLRDGLGPRDGQLVCISTAGDTEDSPLGDLRARAYELATPEADEAHRHIRTEAFALHEWSLSPDEDRDDLEIVKRANPATWMTIEELERRKESPSMTPAQWARFACGVWGLGVEPAFDLRLWQSLASPGEQIEPGRLIALGFDGSRRFDATVLVAADVEKGHLIVVGAWERPLDADDEWEIPESEVDQAVEYAFDTWEVWRLYGDPPWWGSAMDRWAGQYGEEKIVRWWTNRVKATAIAIRAFVADWQPDRLSHNDDELLNRHIGNAVRRETKMIEDGEPLWLMEKDSRKSLRKIDGAMAAVLAWQARSDAVAKGAGVEPEYAAASWQ